MIYAIGDIHGQYDLLRELYTTILRHMEAAGDKDNTIVFLGDYVDRGSQNQKVLDFLIHLESGPGLKHIFLKGNHEQIFINAMENPLVRFHVHMWLNNGGAAFLKEAGMNFDYFNHTFPWVPYVRWMKIRTDLYHETEDYVFAHGGLDIRKPNMKEQDDEYLMWARHTDKNWYRTFPKMVVHGHTPNANPQVDINRINVDTSGLHSPNLNRRCLTAVALPNRRYESHLEPEFLTAIKEES